MKYRDPEAARTAIIQVTTMLDEFLWKLEDKYGRVATFEKETNEVLWEKQWRAWGYDEPPKRLVQTNGIMATAALDDFGYAEAYLHWAATGRNPKSCFSCTDLWMILYREELTKEFGLPCLTLAEAAEFKKKNDDTQYETQITTGDPTVSPKYNKEPKKSETVAEIENVNSYMRRHFPFMFNPQGGAG